MKTIITGLLIFVVLGCSSSEKVTQQNKCPEIYKNDFTEIRNEKYETVYNKDTITFNEIRFECVYSSLYTKKVMFDKFGKWNKTVYPSNKKQPILIWKEVDLFSNGKKYDVFTNGNEGRKHIYAAVMVFDESEADLLAMDSPERENLTNYFAALLKSHDTENTDFYEIYWKMVDPEKWERIKG